MRVHPMPHMRSQVGRFGLLGGVDLNCGWYCLRSVIAYWFETLQNAQMNHSGVPKHTVCGFDPMADVPLFARQHITRVAKPTSIAGWVQLLTQNGPVIVSGKLGAADWGSIAGKKMGVGHYILIVGAHVNRSQLYFKDPLQGDVFLRGDFAHMDARIDNWVDYVTPTDAPLLLQGLGTH